MKLTALALMLIASLSSTGAAEPSPAAQAINSFGIDLYRRESAGEANLLFSPYSIQTALAMTYAGADGDTRQEMQRVLHFPAKDEGLHESFAALDEDLTDIAADSVKRISQSKERGGPTTPIEFNVANRLFPQKRYPLRPAFLDLLKRLYQAPPEELDFSKPEPARQRINAWVEEQTKQKIRDLIPSGALSPATRLVLANAIYLRAPWDDPFSKSATRDEPFHVRGKETVPVATMVDKSHCGYAERTGYKLITRAYLGRQLQFVIVLPSETAGLAKIERELSAADLAAAASTPSREIILHLPKFRLEPASVQLSKELKALGLKSAFDEPRGSANFDRMAPRKPDDYLFISEVIHKAFLALDENGTEAAAATAVLMLAPSAILPAKPQPLEVHVDRPFLFAIQHVPTGVCLFLGRVTDPR